MGAYEDWMAGAKRRGVRPMYATTCISCGGICDDGDGCWACIDSRYYHCGCNHQDYSKNEGSKVHFGIHWYETSVIDMSLPVMD